MTRTELSIPDRARAAAFLQEPDRVPVGLLIAPAVFQEFAGINGDDYFSNKSRMLEAQVSFQRRFAEAMLISGIRPDYGTSAMASGFGFRLYWLSSGPRLDTSSRSIDSLKKPADPYHDGLMPRVLDEIVYFAEHVDGELKATYGNTLWVSFTLGPLQSIAELIGYNEVFSRMYKDPVWVREMCEVQTQTAIAWVKAQEDALLQAGVTPGRLFLADESIGLVSGEHLREFFLPYVQRIYAASRAEIKCFHADEDVTHVPDVLLEMGANIYNFNYSPIRRLKRLIGHRICLEGNIPSVKIMAEGTPLQVEEAVREAIQAAGAGGGYIVSTGGGVSTGTPASNIDALIAAAEKYGQYPLGTEPEDASEPQRVSKTRRVVRPPAVVPSDFLGTLASLVTAGEVEEVPGAVGRALEAGLEPQRVLMDGLARGLQRMAQLYYQKQIFMPELVMACAAFEEGLGTLTPHLDTTSNLGEIVIGAVQGNVQESGILLVGAALSGTGFRVHNIGVNVSPQGFMDGASEKGARIVAVGVYTRDRLPVVEQIVRLARERGLVTLVGGKGITREQASEVGADAFGEDVHEAVQRALELVGR